MGFFQLSKETRIWILLVIDSIFFFIELFGGPSLPPPCVAAV